MIFGLVAALGWGLADFFAALAGRRVGSTATVLVGQAMSAVFMTALFLASGTSTARLHGLIGFVLLNGIFTATAYATHYHALELGPVAIVSPIGASYAVVAIALAVVLLGDRPSAGQLVGAGVTVFGVMLVSTDLRSVRAGLYRRAAGFRWAVASAVGFGVAALLLGYVAREAGWVAGLWGSRVAQVACYVPLIVFRPAEVGRLRGASSPALLLAAAAGAADILGVTAYAYGAEHGFLTLVLAASAVFPLIAVVLSYRFLHERLVPNQYAGIAVVVGGLLMLALS